MGGGAGDDGQERVLQRLADGRDAMRLNIQETAAALSDISIDAYLSTALDKDALDPLNASRIMASNILNLLSPQVEDGLGALSEQDKGELVDDRIIAPLLRVGPDFETGQTVWAQTSHRAPWAEHPIVAIEQASGDL